MKVDQVTVFHLKMDLIHPWVTAYGSDHSIESIFVRMRSDGLEGWGESCPLGGPFYSSEYAAGCFGVLRDWLAPRLIGSEVSSGDELQRRLAPVKGNYFAKAALDAAWWDLQGRILQTPLYRLLGSRNNTVLAGEDFGVRDSVEELLDLVGAALAGGAPRVKLKYAPGWDIPMLEKVRGKFPEATIHIDCNGAYSLADTEMFRKLEDFRLAMIEQPLRFDDLNDHARLQGGMATPVCLDESITSPERTRQAIDLKACRWINIKPGRVGGVTNALKIHDICQSAGIPCWIGSMLESSLGAMLCAALGTLDNFKYPADIFPFSKFYKKDIAAPALAFSSPWRFTLPETPGVGTEPDRKHLKRITLQKAVISA